MRGLSALARLLGKAGLSSVGKLAPAIYAQDGLLSVHNHDFMRDPAFARAYDRGVKALGGTDDYHWHWRIHVGLWAACGAVKLDGDFVECGVNKGFLSSSIMEHLDWNSLARTFYLLDTFTGLDEHRISDSEIRGGILDANRERLSRGYYVSGVEAVVANFAQWRNVRIIQGAVPDTLPSVDTDRIAYLHLDMNCAPPEVAAANHFWDRLVPGAFMLLDDYAYVGYEAQKVAMDAFASEHDVAICSLPTGQGLIIKPAR
jgi:hypothetical protein